MTKKKEIATAASQLAMLNQVRAELTGIGTIAIRASNIAGSVKSLLESVEEARAKLDKAIKKLDAPATAEMRELCLMVTASQVFPLHSPQGKTLALARCVLNEQIQMTGIRIVDGVNGLFVAYPNDPGYKGDDYRPLYYPITQELRDHIEEVLLNQYHEVKEIK